MSPFGKSTLPGKNNTRKHLSWFAGIILSFYHFEIVSGFQLPNRGVGGLPAGMAVTQLKDVIHMCAAHAHKAEAKWGWHPRATGAPPIPPVVGGGVVEEVTDTTGGAGERRRGGGGRPAHQLLCGAPAPIRAGPSGPLRRLRISPATVDPTCSGFLRDGLGVIFQFPSPATQPSLILRPIPHRPRFSPVHRSVQSARLGVLSPRQSREGF